MIPGNDVVAGIFAKRPKEETLMLCEDLDHLGYWDVCFYHHCLMVAERKVKEIVGHLRHRPSRELKTERQLIQDYLQWRDFAFEKAPPGYFEGYTANIQKGGGEIAKHAFELIGGPYEHIWNSQLDKGTTKKEEKVIE